MKITQTPEVIYKTSVTIKAFDKPLETDDLEIIPIFLTSKVVLKIEEIPPLDVFYSLKHKVVVNRQIKRKRTKQTQALVAGNAPFEVLSKDSQAMPLEDLGRFFPISWSI